MTKLTALRAIAKFIEENICTRITLMKASDEQDAPFELVNPGVDVAWITPDGAIQHGGRVRPPMILVGMEAANTGNDAADMSVRLLFMVWNPGKFDGTGWTPTYEGYSDLLNLMELTERIVIETRVLCPEATIQLPYQSGMHNEVAYPYWTGWATFTVPLAPYGYALPPEAEYEGE